MTAARILCFLFLAGPIAAPAQQLRHVQARISTGVIEGVVSADDQVRTFKGVPFAAPPVGLLRWRPPQPVPPWRGVLTTIDYGPRPMQGRINKNMVFHDATPSEDCLYLNLWLPEHAKGRLPVMVWVFGGGFVAGSTSEPRQDGGNLCKKGVVVVSMNYRLGVFGFLAHPNLARESADGAAGNYGLMDQVAALRWVRDNIAVFGGDPGNVTLFGESAGSMSVNALMASPMARGLFSKAIGESGAFLEQPGAVTPPKLRTLAQAEAVGARFGESIGARTAAQLRAISAEELLDAALKAPRAAFWPDIDGLFLKADPHEVFASGRQARVPLIAGSNLDEKSWKDYFGKKPPTLANYRELAASKFPGRSAEFLRLYPAGDDAEARRSASDLQSDLFMGYCAWKWADEQRLLGGPAVYRYRFEETLPLRADAPAGARESAPHAGEIEFVFRMLSSRPLPWRPQDRRVSGLMADYWTNFAKTGNPNGPGLPDWPQYTRAAGLKVMHLRADPGALPDTSLARYAFLAGQ